MLVTIAALIWILSSVYSQVCTPVCVPRKISETKIQAPNHLHPGYMHYLFCFLPCPSRQTLISLSDRYFHSFWLSFFGPCLTNEAGRVSVRQHALTHCQVCPNYGTYFWSSFPKHLGAMPCDDQSYGRGWHVWLRIWPSPSHGSYAYCIRPIAWSG